MSTHRAWVHDSGSRISCAECWSRVPIKTGDEKYMVEGRGQGGRMVRVVYVLDSDNTRYVIHAMPLTMRRRRRRR